MGTLTCSRCEATTEADSIEEGRKILDHAKGLVIGKPCEDGKAELVFTGKVKASKPKLDTSKTVGKTKQTQSKD